jgi:cytochrome b561
MGGIASVQLNDTASGYGWISISLHWITAATVIAMFVIGVMSQAPDRDTHLRLVHLHTSIGIAMYAFLWARIVWRFKIGHPGPLPKQGSFFFTIGKYFHFVMLIAITIMLLSGPLMVWANGDAIFVFGFAVPSPVGVFPVAHDVLRRVHGATASFILAAIVLHVLAVFKHAIINRDGTFDKIMIAARGSRD